MGDVEAERVVRNDAVFREVNESIAGKAQDLDATDAIPFLCECPDPTCTAVVVVSAREYARVREHPDRFLHVAAHDRQPAETRVVVERHDRYVVVEKRDRPADATAEADAARS